MLVIPRGIQRFAEVCLITAVHQRAVVIHQIDVFLILLVQLVYNIAKCCQLDINRQIAEWFRGRDTFNSAMQRKNRLWYELR
ncbi:hypothetical protein D3C81_2070200 [compost metagenome]